MTLTLVPERSALHELAAVNDAALAWVARALGNWGDDAEAHVAALPGEER